MGDAGRGKWSALDLITWSQDCPPSDALGCRCRPAGMSDGTWIEAALPGVCQVSEGGMFDRVFQDPHVFSFACVFQKNVLV